MKSLQEYINESKSNQWGGTVSVGGKGDVVNFMNYDEETWENLPQYIFTFSNARDKKDFLNTTYINEFLWDMYDYAPEYLLSLKEYSGYDYKKSQALLNKYGQVVLGNKLIVVCFDEKDLNDFIERCERVEKDYEWKKVERKNI